MQQISVIQNLYRHMNRVTEWPASDTVVEYGLTAGVPERAQINIAKADVADVPLYHQLRGSKTHTSLTKPCELQVQFWEYDQDWLKADRRLEALINHFEAQFALWKEYVKETYVVGVPNEEAIRVVGRSDDDFHRPSVHYQYVISFNFQIARKHT